ncbi:dihydrofolate reductase family protein [Pseudoduganella violaceinigra]|uniref:dihydrofolate reductase family protein n=1 Tax=Pseudoduganella violaceinigra TaxID=246602 RepID=UPI0004890A61|nr:dihydrofolate reductase family protein [Pseudoduganella violaceinigra]
MKTSVFIACSLDGFIAREDGNLDWLMSRTPVDGENGYDTFMAGIDVIVMGRNTFETVLGFEDWPYEGKRVVVLSRAMDDMPASLQGKVQLHRGPVRALYDSLAANGCRGLYVDGGLTVQSFIREDLVDELTVTTIPILLGAGIPLFGHTSRDIPLRLMGTRQLPGGLVQNTYATRLIG